MIGATGEVLQGTALTEGNTYVTNGVFVAPHSIECVAAGEVKIEWLSGTSQTISMAAGQANPIKCKNISVSSGTFNIGYE